MRAGASLSGAGELPRVSSYALLLALSLGCSWAWTWSVSLHSSCGRTEVLDYHAKRTSPSLITSYPDHSMLIKMQTEHGSACIVTTLICQSCCRGHWTSARRRTPDSGTQKPQKVVCTVVCADLACQP